MLDIVDPLHVVSLRPGGRREVRRVGGWGCGYRPHGVLALPKKPCGQHAAVGGTAAELTRRWPNSHPLGSTSEVRMKRLTSF